MKKIYILIVSFLISYGIFAQTYTTSSDELESLVNDSGNSGGTFIVKNGTYNDFEATFEIMATAENPIVVKAESIGGVTLTGESHFTFKKSAYITLEGFVFDCSDTGTLVKLEGCNNIRISRNVFEQAQTDSAKWVYIGGVWDDKTFPFTYPSHNNRIDHNIFQNKTLPGHYITIDGSTDEDTDTGYQSQYDRIDHNHFKNNSPRATNEQESIRIGWSEMSMSSGYTTVEFNLFEDCDGDPEIVSVKSSDNIIRHNTFKNSYGTLSLRHGNRNRVEGNYFFGNGKPQGVSPAGSNLYTGGIRIYGTDHVIINNYFEGLNGTKWDAPITLTLGDRIDGSSTNWSSHFRAEDILIAYNTLVNNDHGIEIGYSNGGKYDKDLANITIANNLITGSKNALVEIIDDNDQGSNITWINNLMYPTGSATTLEGATSTSFNGTSDAVNEDPNLVLNTNITYDNTSGIWKTSASTPLYTNGVTSEAVNEDIQGQERPSTSNPGADHFSAESERFSPLATNDVGPYAADDGTVIENLSVTSVSDFIAAGESKTSTINSNLNWTVTDDSDWISVTPTEGAGNGTISISTTENTTFSNRTGTITVSGGSLSRNITVTQEAADPTSGLQLINDNSANDNVTVTASTEQSGNEAINTLDEDFDTRWSGEGIGAEIIYDLGSVYNLDLVSIATISGKTYYYEIWVSENGTDYTKVSSVESNTSGDYENYIVTNTARYVKIIGNGQSGGSVWNSITEIQIWGTIANSSTDDDNDGVLNDNDLCPNTPDGEEVDVNGCSNGQLDDDDDGIQNSDDICPDTPSGEEVNSSGCSESEIDDDSDGVMNNVDQCPNTPEGEDANSEGCSDSQLDGLIPADLMDNCKQWKITYPTGEEDKTLCDEPNNEFFFVNEAQDAIVFYAPIRSDNGTTPNSSNIRSELRERVQDGSVDIYWTTEGSHMIYVKQAITHLPINKPHLVATQIHGNKDDGIDDAMVLRLEDSHLFLSFNGGKLRDDLTIKTDYTLGTVHEVIFEIIDGKHYCYYSEDGNLLSAFNNNNADSYLIKDNGNDYVMDLQYDESYFKVGNYTQSNADEEGSDTDDPENYGEVLVYDFSVKHDDVSVTGVNLSPTSIDILLENTYQLSGSVRPVSATNLGVSYSSSNSAIASVDSDGLVTAVSEGTATITVTSDEGGFTDESEINVYAPAVLPNLALDKSVIGTGTPDGENIVANLNDGLTSTRWSVSGFPQIATIDLGAVYNLERTELVAYSERIYQYTVSVSSSENGPETMIVDRYENHSPAAELNPNIDLFSTISGRYVKITITSAEEYSGSWVSLLEFRIFGNSNSGNENDSDGDGVLDDVDVCPDTPAGSAVDANGCVLLGANNFTLESIGETCLDKGNGQLIISAQQDFEYNVSFDGNDYPLTNSSELIIDELTPGTYEVCIEVKGVTSPYCYLVVIEGGITVAGKSVTNKNKTTVEILNGTAPYSIHLNGEAIFQTMSNTFELSTEPGDVIEVKTDVSCEGIFAKTIEFLDKVSAYPNPTMGPVQILIPTGIKDVVIELYNNNGQRISINTYKVLNGKAQIDLSNYAIGLYHVIVYLDKPVSLSVIKK